MTSFTIITPSLNRATLIGRAMESVARQDWPAVQHLVVDGGSGDGTAEVVRSCRGAEFIAAAGSDSHAAMNIGLTRATGEIVGFLNTDDEYETGAFAAVAARLGEASDVDIIAGGVSFVDDDDAGRVDIARTHSGDRARIIELTLGAPSFNSWFFRRRVFDRLAPFDTSFDIAADREFLLRAAAAFRIGVLDRPIYRYHRHGGSRTLNRAQLLRADMAMEHMRLADRFASRPECPPSWRRPLDYWRSHEAAALRYHGHPPAGPGRARSPIRPFALVAALVLKRWWSGAVARKWTLPEPHIASGIK